MFLAHGKPPPPETGGMDAFRYPISEELREAMRAARLRLKLTNAELARRLGGVQDTIVYNIIDEGGRRDKSSIHLPRLAKELEIDLVEWMPVDDDQRRILRALEDVREAGGEVATFVAEVEIRSSWIVSKQATPKKRPRGNTG